MFFKDSQEYEEYLKRNEIEEIEELKKEGHYFKWTDDGKIIIDNNKYRNSALQVDQYTNCDTWMLLDDKKTMALIKYPFGDIYRLLDKTQYYIVLYNNILLPQIAKQFGNISAKYYLAINKQKQTRVLTLDFKEQGEGLIHGEELLEEVEGNINELEIKKILERIEEYLIEQGMSEETIQRVKIDFIKQSFFNKFIKQTDENNHNWGVLINEREKSARIAPLYDMECSCDCGTRTRHLRKVEENGGTTLESFIKHYKNEDWFQNYIGEVLENFDIDKAIEDSKSETKINIPLEYRNKYKDFFGHRIFELRSAYKKYILENHQEVEETIEK